MKRSWSNSWDKICLKDKIIQNNGKIFQLYVERKHIFQYEKEKSDSIPLKPVRWTTLSTATLEKKVIFSNFIEFAECGSMLRNLFPGKIIAHVHERKMKYFKIKIDFREVIGFASLRNCQQNKDTEFLGTSIYSHKLTLYEKLISRNNSHACFPI